MDLAEILPIDSWPAFAWLGRLDWMEVKREANLVTSVGVRWQLLRSTPGWEQHRPRLEKLLRDGPERVWLDALAELIQAGPKVFEPSDEQFESMQEVDLRLPIADLRTPYPALVVKIPRLARRLLAERARVDLATCPQWVLVRHRAPGFWFLGCHFMGHIGDQTHVFQDRPGFASVEDALLNRVRSAPGYDGLFEFSERAGRAALNLCLMLVHYGHQESGPLDPVAYARHRRRPSLAHLCHGDFLTVAMVQDIVVRQVEHTAPAPGPAASGGEEMPPHWRRGHWRREAGYREVLARGESPRRVFIRPVLVRADRAVGDLSLSRVTYHTRSPIHE